MSSIRIKNKNWTVLKEHTIPTTAGIRRPDLIVYEDNNAVVIAVAVVLDNGKLDDSHKPKVEYYNNNEITNWIKNRTNCTNVDFGAYVVSWRGCQRKFSQLFLSAHFELPQEFYSLTSAITCVCGYHIWRHYKTSTYNIATI